MINHTDWIGEMCRQWYIVIFIFHPFPFHEMHSYACCLKLMDKILSFQTNESQILIFSHFLPNMVVAALHITVADQAVTNERESRSNCCVVWPLLWPERYHKDSPMTSCDLKLKWTKHNIIGLSMSVYFPSIFIVSDINCQLVSHLIGQLIS